MIIPICIFTDAKRFERAKEAGLCPMDDSFQAANESARRLAADLRRRGLRTGEVKIDDEALARLLKISPPVAESGGKHTF